MAQRRDDSRRPQGLASVVSRAAPFLVALVIGAAVIVALPAVGVGETPAQVVGWVLVVALGASLAGPRSSWSRHARRQRGSAAVRGQTLPFRLVLAVVVLAAATAALARSEPGAAGGRTDGRANTRSAVPVAGVWRRLPAAPIAPDGGLTSVWTGRQMFVFGRRTTRAEDGAVTSRVDVAALYTPATNRWRRLFPPGPTGSFMDNSAVWTGKEALVWGQGTHEAFDPATSRWRPLPPAPLAAHDAAGIVVWTGREMIGWGGGCCGDAFSDGAAYRPTTNTWRKLSRSPLAGSQDPIGAWTGRELIILVGGENPATGKPWPARLARAAAYDPATGRWRRIAPLPAARPGADAVWDGRELLVVGGKGALRGFAYVPSTNRWRRLPRMERGRTNAAAVWTGRRLLVWGGLTAYGIPSVPGHGLAYEPARDRWSPLPPAPVPGRTDPAAVWTGTQLLVWGGGATYPPFTDGAGFRPRTG